MNDPKDARIVELENALRISRDESTKLGIKFKPIAEDGPFAKMADSRFFPYLEAIPSLSTRGISPEKGQPHVLIESDNLLAMSVYNSAFGTITKNGSVGAQNFDVIYIDPPYNTGAKAGDGVFVYNDEIVTPEDPLYHSKWLRFMEERLREFRDSLAETGVILISIGEEELFHLKLLADRVFTASNYVSMVTWKGAKKNDARLVSNVNDYILIYARDLQDIRMADILWRADKEKFDDYMQAGADFWESVSHIADRGSRAEEATRLFREWISSLPKDHEYRVAGGGGFYNYRSIDENGDIFYASDMSWPGGGGPEYEVKSPLTGNMLPAPGRGWVFSTPERFKEEQDAGNILFFTNDRQPLFKRYLKNVSTQVKDNNIFQDRRSASKELANLIGKGPNGKPLFNNPKDRHILAEWIDYVTPLFRKREALEGNKPIRILDGFAGSGTTLHAVMDLNKADGVPRQCTLITINEGDSEEGGLARSVTSRRIQAAITGDWAVGGKRPGYDDSLYYYKLNLTDGEDGRPGYEISMTGDKTIDASENIELFEGYFDGIASVKVGAHIPLQIEVPGVESERFAAFTNESGTKALLVWKSAEYAYFHPEILKTAAEAVALAVPTAVEHILYAPGRAKDEFVTPDGWELFTFPLDYIQNLVQTINRYKNSLATARALYGASFIETALQGKEN